MLWALVVGIAALVICIAVFSLAMLWYENRHIGHILSGAQRRELFPIETGVIPSANAVLNDADFDIKREYYTLKNGEKHFCQVIKLANKVPSYVLVFLHGYTSAGDIYLETIAPLVRQGAVIVMPDLPCHGRSDGDLAYILDWWAWIDRVWELLDLVVPPLRTLRPEPLRVFVAGISMGGLLAACLVLQRQNFFDGMVLIAPALGPAPEMMPSAIEVSLLRTFVLPFKVRWPITPVPDLSDYDFRVPEQGRLFTDSIPINMRGLKIRLMTAYCLGFAGPEWLRPRLPDVRIPFLVLHGDSDKITDPTVSKQLHDEARSTDKAIKIYPGAYHCELLSCCPGNAALIKSSWLPEQTRQTEQCVTDMAEWLRARA